MLTFPIDFPQPIIPEVDSGSFKEDYADSTIATATDAGYKKTRPRASRMPGTWSYSWRAVSDEDYQRLIDFWFAVHGTADMFYFTPYYGPAADQQKIVRFASKGDWQPYHEGYRGSLTLEEV